MSHGHTHRRVGRPLDQWAVKAMEQVSEEIRRKQPELRHTRLDVRREDVKEAIKTRAHEAQQENYDSALNPLLLHTWPPEGGE